MNVRPIAAIAVGISMALTAVACGSPDQAQPSQVEVEDCDAEDYINKEDDCGFTDADRKKQPAKVKVPTKKKS